MTQKAKYLSMIFVGAAWESSHLKSGTDSNIKLNQTPKQRANLIEWIAALESGLYDQTKGKLTKLTKLDVTELDEDEQEEYAGIEVCETSFCCHGVAAFLDDSVEVQNFTVIDNSGDFTSPIYNYGEWCSKATPSREWFKKRFGLPGCAEINAMSANDSGATFLEIAAKLRKYL